MEENEKEEEIRMRIRELCYKVKDTTYNTVELFLLNRFPDGGESYWTEWIERLHKPNATSYMDSESFRVWVEVCRLCSGNTSKNLLKGVPQ